MKKVYKRIIKLKQELIIKLKQKMIMGTRQITISKIGEELVQITDWNHKTWKLQKLPNGQYQCNEMNDAKFDNYIQFVIDMYGQAKMKNFNNYSLTFSDGIQNEDFKNLKEVYEKKEKRVYMICTYNMLDGEEDELIERYGVDQILDIPDEEFMQIAEKQGLIFTIPKFIDFMNEITSVDGCYYKLIDVITYN